MKIRLTTESLFTAYITIMTRNISRANPMCTLWRVLTICFVGCFLSIPRKSTQNDVVSAVRAESVVAKVAAVSPSRNTMAGTSER